jgi:ubiquinol-cytochrome c reductase iron-sulfur subunit
MADTTSPADTAHADEGATRRDFLYLTTGFIGAIGVAAAVWPLVNSMNPSAEVLALASTEVDLSPVEEGQSITVTWRGNPVFIRRRTAAEIAAAQDVDLATLPDPETDEARAPIPEWLIIIGVCTHLGCVPLGQKVGENRGDWDGWFCPCHGSHYDTSGRIRKGPAPTNLPVPPYEFLDDTKILIG